MALKYSHERAREARGSMTVVAAAKALGIARAQVYEQEGRTERHGRKVVPSADRVGAMADVYGRQVAFFFVEE